MKGSVTCSRCGSRMDEETGFCIKCRGKSCAVKLYWKGKQHRFRRGFKNKVLNYITAEKYLDYLRSEIDRLGDDFDPVIYSGKAIRDRIFEVVWTRFIAEKQKLVEKEKRSPEYIRVLESYYRKHYVSLHDRDVRDITKATIRNLYDAIIAKSKTAKNVMDGLRTFMRWCFDAGLIDVVPPFPAIEIDDETIRPALGIEAQAEQFKLIPDEHRGVYIFESETGLRPSETCALKIADIDLENAVMLVRRTFSGTKDRNKTKHRKENFIPLSPVALEIARLHMQ
ncbi:MAG: tyrosine-type recombinase/integrase, partial [Syntrophorhabdaceae bacterium]